MEAKDKVAYFNRVHESIHAGRKIAIEDARFLLIEVQQREAVVHGALAILNQQQSLDDCQCGRCRASIAAAKQEGWSCETCGYSGQPFAYACQCHDSMCGGSGSNGTGCPHGAIGCPVCDDGERDLSQAIRELRALLEPQ